MTKLKSIHLLLLIWLASILSPLAVHAQTGYTLPTIWGTRPLATADNQWWTCLSFATVPGVKYQVEKSHTLLPGEWETIAIYHGAGQEIDHPIFPCPPPAAAPEGDPTVLPVSSQASTQTVAVQVEKNEAGAVLLSWASVVDRSPIRVAVPALTLDSVWYEQVGVYLNAHGDYLFVVSASLLDLAEVSGSAPVLSPQDANVLQTFTNAFADITQNLKDGIGSNRQSSAPSTPDPALAAFFRIVADWGVDSDGDSIFDWREICLEGTNPYSADTDGDGITDQNETTIVSAAASPKGDVDEPLPPKVTIQHRDIKVSVARDYAYEWQTEDVYYADIYLSHGEIPQPANDSVKKRSFSELAGVVNGFSMGADETGWNDGISVCRARNESEEGAGAPGGFTTLEVFKQQFRAQIDRPAPAGGYKVPMRFMKLYRKFRTETGGPWLPEPSPAGASSMVEIEMVVPEGETVSPLVSLQMEAISEEMIVDYVPIDLTVSLPTNPDHQPVSGVCVVKESSIRLNLNPALYFEPGFATVKWEIRQLCYDGTFTEWEEIPGEGLSNEYATERAGIFQVQAVVKPTDSTRIEIPFVRKFTVPDAKNANGENLPVHEQGAPDYFGVTEEAWQESVRMHAYQMLGSAQYAKMATVQVLSGGRKIPFTDKDVFVFSAKSDKCNLFVYHKVNDADGAPPVTLTRGALNTSGPPMAIDWWTNNERENDSKGRAIKTVAIPFWDLMADDAFPEPGLVVSRAKIDAEPASYHTHCGILDYDGSWISAGPFRVNKYCHISDAEYRPIRTRR